jgi:hypothetical protein
MVQSYSITSRGSAVDRLRRDTLPAARSSAFEPENRNGRERIVDASAQRKRRASIILFIYSAPRAPPTVAMLGLQVGMR